jgi:hypothetical protein
LGKTIGMRPYLLLLNAICLILLTGGCSQRSEGVPANNQNDSKYTQADLKNFEFEDSHPDCQAASDCILMRVGGCLNMRAVHVAEIDLAEEYTRYAKKLHPNVVCAPELPPEEYESLCLNRRCTRTTRSSRLLLEVPEQPIAGQPFWVGMSFRFPVAAEVVDARFLLPDDVQILTGQGEWHGSLNALEDHVMWVQVQTNRAGPVYLSGWAGIPGGNPAITPLNWGKYFEIILSDQRTPQPTSQSVLPTPTPVGQEEALSES